MKSNRTTALLMLLVFLLVVAVVIIFLTGLDRPARSDNPYQNVTVSAAPSVAVETPEPTPTVMPTAAPTPSVPVYYPPATTAPSQTATPVTTAAPPSAATAAPSGATASTPTPIPGADNNMLPAQDLIPVVPGATTGTGTGTGDAAGAAGDPAAQQPNLIPTGTSLGSGTFRSDSGSSINIHADWNAVVSGAGTVDITVTAFVDSYSLYTTASPEALNIAVDGQYVSLASPAIEIANTNGQVSTLINNRTFTVSLSGGETRSIPIEVVWNYRGTYGGTYLETIECGGNVTLSR